MSNRKTKLLLQFFFLFFLGLMAYFKFSFHELWKDEWQAWLIANDSGSLNNLFALLPGEGHPPLWFLLLKLVGFTKLILPNIQAHHLLQGFHLLMYAGSLYLFLFKFKFNLWIKITLLSGYFLFFEYGVINRSYVVLLFLSFLISWLSEHPQKTFWWLTVGLFLLCITEVYGFFIALSFLSFIYFRIRKTQGDVVSKYWLLPFSGIILGLLVFLFSVGVFSGSSSGLSSFNSFEGKNIVEKIFLAIQSLFANTLWIGATPFSSQEVSKTAILFSLSIILLLHLFLRKQKWMYLSYFIFISCLFLFTLLFYQGGPRQWGVHLILLISLLNHFKVERLSPGLAMFSFYLLLVSIVFFQGLHNFKIVLMEKSLPFSNSKHAGHYIKNNISTEDIIIGVNKAYCTPVIGYSERSFIELPSQQAFSYFIFNEKTYLPSPTDLEVFARNNSNKKVYVVSYIPFPLGQFKNLVYVREFSRRNIRNENYFIYYINPERL
ncbi:MAG TPA: hypothetical protein PKM16_10560 [Bacteroidia bacterium]|nr:hypothetical protein [Bacteroidia bacterium]